MGRVKGAILFRKREWPLWNPKRKALIGNLELEQLSCLRSESACVAALLTLAAHWFYYTICLYFYYPLPLC